MGRVMRGLVFGVVASFVLGACAPKVNVERVRAESTLLRDRQSVLTGHGLSEQSRVCLRLHDLEEDYYADPVPTARAVRWKAWGDPDGPWRMAASEMMLEAAEARVGTVRDDPSLFLVAAYYAWEQLEHDLRGRRVVLDGRTEFAADLYNRAAGRFVSLTSGDWISAEGAIDYVGEGGAFRVEVARGGVSRDGEVLWDPSYFDWFKPTEEFQVEGMRNHHRFDGFGATLLAYAENGAERDGAEPWSDGVVGYWSASVPTAESEVVVKSGHNAHGHPIAIEEMRRIVRLHLAGVDGGE